MPHRESCGTIRPMISVEHLIKKTAGGDNAAFERLYIETKGLVFAVSLSVVRNKTEAEDLTADTFLAVKRYAAGYRGGSGKAWLARIARNLALNALKKRAREVFVDYTENESLYGEYSIDEQFADNLALKTALMRLSGEAREIVLMHNAGMKHREIAEAMGLPLGTVTWKYNEALKKLKGYLEEGGGL